MRAHVGLTAALTLGASLDASAYQRTQTPGDDPVSIGWTRRCIAYHLNERGSDDMAFSTFQTVANRAFAAWQSVDCSDVEVHAVGLTNAVPFAWANHRRRHRGERRRLHLQHDE